MTEIKNVSKEESKKVRDYMLTAYGLHVSLQRMNGARKGKTLAQLALNVANAHAHAMPSLVFPVNEANNLKQEDITLNDMIIHNNMKLHRAAEIMDVQVSTLCKYIDGYSTPSVQQLYDLAITCGWHPYHVLVQGQRNIVFEK